MSKGELFASESKLAVAAGEGIAVFIDSDVKFPYRVAGTTIAGEFPPGQQVLCFSFPKAGEYALLTARRVVVDFTVS